MDFAFSEEYHCCAGLEISAASKLIKNCLGSDWPSKVGIMLNLYPKGYCASSKFIDKGELVSIDMNDFW